MRSVIVAYIVYQIITSSVAFAQTQQATTAPALPSGHEAFFSEYYELAKKYPKAGAQFGLTDLSRLSKRPIQKPTADPRYVCCDIPDPTPNTDADCMTTCPK
jgi:hypothetical protein